MAIANIQVRELVKDKGLRYEDIANKIGVSRVWLSKLMSKELSQECKEYVAERILQDSYGMKKIILKLILNG